MGPHSCDGCPGGSSVDAKLLMEQDRVARCFVESCRGRDGAHPEASRMRTRQEWHSFTTSLQERGLVDPEDLELLRDCPLTDRPLEEVEVELDLPLRGRLGADLDKSALEVAAVDDDGPLAAWGREHPSRAARAGDRILRANGATRPEEIWRHLSAGGFLKLTFGRGGLDVNGFQRWLCRRVFAEGQRAFDDKAEAFREAVHGVNVFVGHKGLDSLPRQELYTLQVLLSEYEHSVAGSLRGVLDRVRSAESATDGPFGPGLAAAAGECAGAAGEVEPLPTTPEEFQWAHGPEIERRLREVQVPAVAFPPGERVLDGTAWGLRRLLATAVSSGEEVEVLEVPLDVPLEHARCAAAVANRLDALRQLALSPYFPSYLGSDHASYRGVSLHFLRRPKHAVGLRQLVREVGPLRDDHPLVRHWARHMLLGLGDYLRMCCYELVEDLTLEHVFVHQEGTQVVFQQVPFGDLRGALHEDMPEYGPHNKWRNGFEVTEARLVSMFGAMLLELLCGETRRSEAGPSLVSVGPEFRALLAEALNARDTYDDLRGLLPSVSAGLSAPVQKQQEQIVGLAGGLVTAGLDEYGDRERYRPWWQRPRGRPPVLPCVERSADAAGAGLAEDWGRDEGDLEPPALRWEPNAWQLTLRALVACPALRRRDAEAGLPELLDAWDVLRARFEARRFEEFVDAVC